MEQLENIMGTLELLVRPAFCVRDGIIQGVNRDAQRHLITVGTRVQDLIPDGKEEYAEFREGCLYLNLDLEQENYGVSITRRGDFHIFVLEQSADLAELQVMALAAQELREPLANVMTVADRLFPLVAGDDSQQEQISRINRGLYQMLRVISNMSDAAAYQHGMRNLFEVREITTIMEEIFQRSGELLAQTGIQVRFQNHPQRIYTLVDVEKLERAVYNILSNAAKFTSPGGSIEARLYRRGVKLYLTVQDTGSGVDPQVRSTVHARYHRQPGVEDGRFGLGLGMVLIRSAATAHKGTVFLEHPQDLGCRITMTMTIQQPGDGSFRSDIFRIDYAGDRDHALIELSDALPPKFYDRDAIN